MKKSVCKSGLFRLAGILLLVCAWSGAAKADTETLSSNVVQQIFALQQEKASFTPTEQKMDSQLIFAYKRSQNLPIANGAVPNLQIAAQPDTNGSIKVDIKANVTSNLLAQIQLAGGTVISSFSNLNSVRALIPVGDVETIAALPELKFIQLAVGSLNNNSDAEGVVVHRDDVARSTFAVDGSNIKVGVLSDSVDYLSQVQGLGNLGQVTVLPGQSGVPATGEGTAMLEIVHAMAPGAQLFFASGSLGEASFAQNIRTLRYTYGCDIIVDDIGYFDESPFQDGVVAQAVNEVSANGCLYFSSAGNSGNVDSGYSGTWEGDFSSGGAVGSPVNGKGGLIHSFGASTYDTVTRESSEGSPTFLLWSDPLGGSTNDYDLYVLDSTGANVISSSVTVQNGTQDPLEYVTAPTNGQRIVIVLASGTNRFLHLDTERGTLQIGTQGSTRGHNAATNIFCVAATAAAQNFTGFPAGPYPGVFTGGAANPVEFFSSDGPRRMFYQPDGTPFTPNNFSSTGGIVLQKPDITAANGVSCSTPGFSPFFGTSAAAPHAAGIAALMKSLNPTLTVSQVRGIFTNSALDIMGTGVDRSSGVGIIMAYQSLNLVPPPTPAPALLVISNYVTGGNGNGLIDNDECNSLFLVVTNSGSANATTVQGTLSTTNAGVVIVNPTISFPNLPTNSIATNLTAYEISTTPLFICGTPITFQLVTKSDQATTTNQFTITTGTAGTPASFSVVTNLTIPDNSPAGISSPLVVSNISAALYHVTVSMFITHPYVSDLTLNLIAPDGTTVLLAQNVGANGQNFGFDCSTGLETTFDDNATIPIATANAPFIGTFQPAQQLSAFNGKSGAALNGIWQLQLIDSVAEDFGTLNCWTLNLTPSGCVDGGGQCPGVDLSLGMTGLPNPVAVTSNLTYTLNITNSGPDTANSVSLNQTIPSTAQFVSATTTQGSVSFGSGTVSGNLGSLAVGSNVTVTVVIQPQQAGTIFSTAIVGSQNQELNPANNTVTISTVVNARSADLSVALVANPSPVPLAGIITYTATIVNNGPSDATNVVSTNVLPTSVNIVSVTSSQGSVASAANIAIAQLGTIPAGSNATFVVKAQPFLIGNIVDSVNVSSGIPDPAPGNNQATVSTIVTAAADLGVTLTGPNSVIVGSNITYQLTLQNYGPSIATGVTVRDSLPSGLSYISASSTAGTSVISGNLIICTITNLGIGASANITIVASTTNLANSAPINITDSAAVSADQADGNSTNNAASLNTLVNYPTVTVASVGALLASESFVPTNGMIDVGEKVTVYLKLQNLGNIDSGNVVATLQSTGGITPSGTQTQTYGVLAANGAAVSQPFTFTATGTNGGILTATLAIVSGGVTLPSVTYSFTLPSSNSAANLSNIVIPDHGAASPYPSTITVSGVTGVIGKVTATITNINHTYPDDVDILLVGPAGQNVLLMSHAGYNGVLTNVSLTFDDAATNSDGTPKYLPSNSQILSGSYIPSQYGTVNFGSNAPAGPYGTNLAIFNGTNANGVWSLFVYDSSPGDSGVILGGWKLNITSGTLINPVVDLAIAGKVTPTSVLGGSNLTYTFTLTNNGPNLGNSVTFSNALPTNLAFVSATNSAGVAISTNGAGVVHLALANLPVGSNVTVTVVATAIGSGTITSPATISSPDSDINQANNLVNVIATATLPMADVAIQISGTTNSVVSSNISYTLSVVNNGPGTALGVTVSNPVPSSFTFVSGVSTLSGVNPALSNGVVTCNLGSLSSGSNALVTLTFAATHAGLFTNVASVSTLSTDSVSSNNSASFVTLVTVAVPNIVSAGAHLLSGPANGAIGSGQTVSVSLLLANTGTADTTNLVATLLSTNGISAQTASQPYGVLIHGGAAVGRSFSFSTVGANGAAIVATLALVDGSNNLGTVSYTFNLPATNAFASTNAIIIPDHGPALPYPSVLSITNLTGYVSKATVTLSNISHEFPNDIQALLVSPTGQSVVLLAGVGGSHSITNVTLTFDDSASSEIAVSSQDVSSTITSGTYLPSNYGLKAQFVTPAPAGPFGSTLSVFNGKNPNGNWALYIFDNSAGDAGIIAGGWSLNLTTVSPINGAADLGITLVGPTGSFYPNTAFAYTITVTNKGPAGATNIVVTDTLPGGLLLTSASVGSYSYGTTGNLSFNLGTLAVNASTNLTLNALAVSNGVYFDTASVTADQADLYLADNTAYTSVSITSLPRVTATVIKTNGTFNLNLLITGQSGIYDVLATTNLSLSLSNWTTVATLTNNANLIQFTDTNAGSFGARYYRAVRRSGL